VVYTQVEIWKCYMSVGANYEDSVKWSTENSAQTLYQNHILVVNPIRAGSSRGVLEDLEESEVVGVKKDCWGLINQFTVNVLALMLVSSCQ
jgi:hypothetical protein